MCIDYRRLNQHIVKENFPTPNIEERLQEAKRYTYFSILDLNCGYYQIPIEPQSRKFTAFITTEGLFEFKRMPFGLKNAPAVFQRLMARLKENTNTDDFIHYMDDMLIGSNTIPEMLKKLTRVFKALRDANLTLNINKCEFLRRNIEFLGHEITPDGIKPGAAKTAVVENFRNPTNITEVRQFLGLSGFFRKFVPGYAVISEPLRRLLRKDEKFAWQAEHEKAFKQLKCALTTKPVLAGYRVEARHEVHTDASSSGIAGVLLQREGDDMKPVVYFSKATTDLEKKFHSYELETLAVVGSLE